MNLAEALNAALPDLPARRARAGYPKLDPEAVHRDNIEDGEPVIVVLIREPRRNVSLSSGTVASHRTLRRKTLVGGGGGSVCRTFGVRYEPEDLREFTSQLDGMGFWYQTPLERNMALQQKLEAGRHQHAHKKSKFGDVAHMQFSAWDPDRYFDHRLSVAALDLHALVRRHLPRTLLLHDLDLYRELGSRSATIHCSTTTSRKRPLPIWPSSGFSFSSSPTSMSRPMALPASITAARCIPWDSTSSICARLFHRRK